MASDKQKTEALRRAITLKNLRRHDDEITDIVAQSPFAVVYYSSVDDNNDFVWVSSPSLPFLDLVLTLIPPQQKSNIEGPMFIFKRFARPSSPHFSLNPSAHSPPHRSQAPFYGFMILNHKGLEYIHQLLTPELDAVSEEGMIMFRTSVNEGPSRSSGPPPDPSRIPTMLLDSPPSRKRDGDLGPGRRRPQVDVYQDGAVRHATSGNLPSPPPS